MSHTRKVIVVPLLMVGAVCVVGLLQTIFRAAQPVTIKGAVLVRGENVDRQVPIPGVQVSVAGGLAEKDVRTSPTGYFVLTLNKRAKLEEPMTLQFREMQYMPLDITSFISDRLLVAHMTPIDEFAGTGKSLPQSTVSNVKIRYTVKTSTVLNVGSTLKTFHVVNSGNVSCNGRYPCSPDGKWQAAVGYSSLEAPGGDFFSNARVSCIAGPCSFTKIRYDGFSRGGPRVRVEVLDWSDTTTFLFEAEVFRSMTSDSVRSSYPVIFGQALHFAVPANAEGLCIEAEIDRQPIVFPLGPPLNLSWATCSESVNPDHTEVYQCELKAGYGFK
ncbi:MAG: carboxypeptidase regulatory-like domain-containing protein [Terriglobia bacterium]|jgi:hypothetical protein